MATVSTNAASSNNANNVRKITKNNDGSVRGATSLAAAESKYQAEQRYRTTLDLVLDIISDNFTDKKIQTIKLLDIGAAYLSMSSGVITSVMGVSLEVLYVCGDATKIINTGDRLELDGTICNHVLNSDDVVCAHDIPNSQYSKIDASHQVDLNAYIGTQILTENGPMGILCFFSDTSREEPFNKQDFKIISLIANWVGSVLGNEEKIEFLTVQNQYYRSLFQTVPAMSMLCNPDGLVLSTSDLLSSELGIEHLSVPGKNCQSFFLDKNLDALNDALATGAVEQLPLTMKSESGNTIEVELSSSVRDMGSMQGLRMIVLADVSERNRAIRAAEKQNRELALINESLNQFAYIASHDLQEPLRKIQQFSYFLNEDLGDAMTDEGQYHLDVISNSATRMSTLIQDLLKFSSAAKGKLDRVDIDLNALLADVCSELELRIEEADALVQLENLPTITGDISLVRQLLINLISNSVKYRDNERRPVITVNSEVRKGQLLLNITDNGIGFDDSNTKKAFELFNRLHKGQKYDGNGIGLSICQTICEKHNWSLTATSQQGKGSTFTIGLDTAV